MNMFTDINGGKKELKNLLEQALEAVTSGKIEVDKIIVETHPSPYDKGFTDKRDVALFGFTFKRCKKYTVASSGPLKGTKTNVPTPPQKPEEKSEKPTQKSKKLKPKTTVNVLPALDVKMTGRMAEEYRKGTLYECPCGFTSKSSRGFTRHFNACKNK